MAQGHLSSSKPAMIAGIWTSFMALPLWVKIWMVAILMPVNMAGLFFLDAPGAVWVTVLSLIGMILNLPIILVQRGMSKMMSLPHIPPWTLLVILLVVQRPAGGPDSYQSFLTILLVVDCISLAFDYVDGWKWWKGDRGIVGH